MEKCINSKVEKLLKTKQETCISEKVREEEKVYSRLFYCLNTLYDFGWMDRKTMRKLRAKFVKQLTPRRL
jgi:hypothetical protein